MFKNVVVECFIMIWKRLLVFTGIIFLLILVSICYPYLTGEVSLIKEEYEREECFVNRIIDGDTLVCGNETIRLLGIDTPERGEFYYEEAKDFLKEIENQNVEVLRDWEDLGKYQRKLRYVFYENRLINVEILEYGLGICFILEGLKYDDKLIAAEKFAKENCVGLWGEDC